MGKKKNIKGTSKMMKQKTADLTPLITRFEADIVYDCHSTWISFERSRAQKKLFNIGKRALKAIVDHLKENPPDEFADLHIAWAMLLNRFEIKLDKNKTAPQKLVDTKGWISWAEKIAY